MKCIKAIKDSYQGKLGEIKRVSDNEAENRVKSGLWKYVSKSEYKQQNAPLIDVIKKPITKLKNVNTTKKNKVGN
jgi:hypothetical protein